MDRKEGIRTVIIYGDFFWTFYNKQTAKVKLRIDWTIGLVEDLPVIPEKYFKHLTGTDLYEIRVSSGNNIFRILCFFDAGKLVILLNGFQKKTQKSPMSEIDRAIQLKKQYYEDKKK
jgi:phage-related protein